MKVLSFDPINIALKSILYTQKLECILASLHAKCVIRPHPTSQPLSADSQVYMGV